MSETRVEVSSRAELRQWLLCNHQQAQSIWLVSFKKGDDRHIPYTEIVDEALCFGWIDSLPRALDEKRTSLRLSPRSLKSAWSKTNKGKVERLIADGQMQPSGMEKIVAAKASGTWDQLNEVDALIVPHDLALVFSQDAVASGNFDLFPASVKRGILEWISSAKKPETRHSRIAETVAKAAQNLRANQWRQK